jgi:GR25 family glycosyltransferase involved in LPS biosynthesis
MPFDDYPVLVIHYTPLAERKAGLSRQLEREGLSEKAFWIGNFDREAITEWPEFENADNKLSKGVIAVNMAHADALRRISLAPEGYGLVLEDDVVFKNGASKLIQEYCSDMPADWDMIFIGGACRFHIPFWRRRPGKHIYLKENTKTRWGGDGATRCADSYFVSKKAALALLDSRAMQRPFSKPIDWALNEAIRDKNLTVYWLEPTVAEQGSQTGAFAKASHQT